MKHKRQNMILKIIKENKIATHKQLIDALKPHNINVTQATVSRDIQELGIIKTPSASGYVYSVSGAEDISPAGMVQNAVLYVKNAMHTIVVKTKPGMAGGMAAEMDDKFDGAMLGSIAGDDTIFIIAENEKGAVELSDRILEAFALKRGAK